MTLKKKEISRLKENFFVSVSRIGSGPQLKRAMKHICSSSILLAIMLLFLYLLCLKLGWIPYFQFILGKVGVGLATRVASFLLPGGWWPSLAMSFLLKTLIDIGVTPLPGNMMLPSGASGPSSSHPFPFPRVEIDLNLPPQEESFPDPIDVYREKDPEKIKGFFDAQLCEKISQKRDAIRGVVEEMVRREISEQGDSRSDCAIPNMKGFVYQVISECAHHFKSENLEN